MQISRFVNIPFIYNKYNNFTKKIRWVTRFAPIMLVKEFYIKQRGEKYYQELLRERPTIIKAETPIVLLGEEIAWVGFPGEFFDDFQIALRNRSPIPHTFFLGYCNDVFSYFPTIQAASEGGYGASYSTYVEVGAGERLVDNAIIRLHKMTGNLKSVPDR
jgi:hypothetical protein